jgi:hypothetical protein
MNGETGKGPTDERARIELLETRARITDLVYRYAHNIRTGKAAECATLFTEDAEFEVREAILGKQISGRTRSRLVGREAIRNYLVNGAASGGGVCPMIHNLLIHVKGREATSSCVMTAVVGASGESLLGEYEDSYRYDGDWRFTSRIFTILRGTPGVVGDRSEAIAT